MNYLPFVGYYFYGAASYLERASFGSSWGLLEITPTGIIRIRIFTIPYIPQTPVIPLFGRR